MPATTQTTPAIQMTVDVIIFTVTAGQLNVLLIRRDREPFAGSWALPGGYLNPDELAHDSALRVLHDKAGFSSPFIEQLYTFDSLDRDPRGRHISVVYYALVPESSLKLDDSADTQHPTLMPVSALPDLAFDHSDIVEYAKKRLQSKLEYTNVAFSLLPRTFTFADLHRTYEAILEAPLDKRNFQKKFLSLGLIELTDETTSGGKHRPARLYRFVANQPTELKKFF